MDDAKSELPSDNYQLVLDIAACIFKAGNASRLFFSLYNHTINKFISEEYTLHLSAHNFPLSGSPEDQKALFKDISPKTLNDDLYIICYLYRFGPMKKPNVLMKSKPDKKAKHMLRPYGVSVLKLKDHIPSLQSRLGQKWQVEPGQSPVFQLNDEFAETASDFVDLPFDIINNNHQHKSHVAPLSIGIANAYVLYQGDVDVVEKNYQFFDKVTIIEPIHDGEWMTSNDVMHIKLMEAHIQPKKKGKLEDIQIRMRIRHNDSYKVLNRITMGRGPMAIFEGDSVVFQGNNDPVYAQIFRIISPGKVKVPIENMRDYHLYFGCWRVATRKNKKDELRGFAFIKFEDIVNTNYKVYTLPLYSYLKKKTVNKYLDDDKEKYMKVVGEGKNVKISVRMGNMEMFLIC